MSLPFVTRAYHEAVNAAYERLIAKLEHDLNSVTSELGREREAARNAMSSAMTFARLGDPYRGKATGQPTPVAKPLGRETAIKVLRRLEDEERELLKKESDGPVPDAAVS